VCPPSGDSVSSLFTHSSAICSQYHRVHHELGKRTLKKLMRQRCGTDAQTMVFLMQSCLQYLWIKTGVNIYLGFPADKATVRAVVVITAFG
jgi:hypothetical protein